MRTGRKRLAGSWIHVCGPLLALALVVGWAASSRADEPAPEGPRDAPVPDRRPSGAGSDPALSAGATPGDAQGAPDGWLEDLWTRDTITGDWGGVRTDLANRGIEVKLRFSQFGQGVATGGVNTRSEYGGLVDYLLNVDVSKLASLPWDGLTISLHAQTRYGKDIAGDAGDFVLPNTPLLFPLPGDYEGTDVTGLTITQSFFDGRLDALFGKLNVIDIWTAFYPNVGSGLEGFLNTNALASAWPFLRFVNLSMWGGGFWTVKPEKGIEGGFLFFGQENVSNNWNFSDSFEDGVGLLGFYRFFWDVAELPGSLLFVALGATKDYNVIKPTVFRVNPFTDVIRPGIESRQPWGAAAYIYQEFWHGSGDKGRKAYLYTGGGVADEEPSFVRWNLFASIEAIGLWSMREADRVGISGWYNRLNDSFTDELKLLGQRPRDDTWGFELYYNLAINRWAHLTADLQLVQNAMKDDDLAIIPGVRLVLDF